jgi:hypothetical protein
MDKIVDLNCVMIDLEDSGCFEEVEGQNLFELIRNRSFMLGGYNAKSTVLSLCVSPGLAHSKEDFELVGRFEVLCPRCILQQTHQSQRQPKASADVLSLVTVLRRPRLMYGQILKI